MQNRKPIILARSADPEAQPQMRRAYTRRQEKPQCALVILVGFAAAFALFVWAGLKIADWEIEQEAIGEKGGGCTRARISLVQIRGSHAITDCLRARSKTSRAEEEDIQAPGHGGL